MRHINEITAEIEEAKTAKRFIELFDKALTAGNMKEVLQDYYDTLNEAERNAKELDAELGKEERDLLLRKVAEIRDTLDRLAIDLREQGLL